MTDVDRYITDEAAFAAALAHTTSPHRLGSKERMAEALHAALPGILAQHRADVLREAADDCDCGSDYHLLRCMADEIVTDLNVDAPRSSSAGKTGTSAAADEAVAE